MIAETHWEARLGIPRGADCSDRSASASACCATTVQNACALLGAERPRATVFGQRLPASGRQSRRSFLQIDNLCKKPVQTQGILCAAAVALEVHEIKKIEP
jgi:hypothetical protein